MILTIFLDFSLMFISEYLKRREGILNFWIHQSVKWKKRHEYEL